MFLAGAQFIDKIRCETPDGDILRWKLLAAVSTSNLKSIARCLIQCCNQVKSCLMGNIAVSSSAVRPFITSGGKS